jgi:secondary thiamine-phosphate synthase enzyme
MPELQMYCDTLEVSLDIGPDIIDITPGLIRCVEASGINLGTVSATMVGSTGSLTTIEYEPGVVEDLKQAVNRFAPPDITYAHELAWHDGNGHSHVQAAIMGPCLTLPIRGGRLQLGTWQQAVAINHDNRSRRRSIEITIVGTTI